MHASKLKLSHVSTDFGIDISFRSVGGNTSFVLGVLFFLTEKEGFVDALSTGN